MVNGDRCGFHPLEEGLVSLKPVDIEVKRKPRLELELAGVLLTFLFLLK